MAIGDSVASKADTLFRLEVLFRLLVPLPVLCFLGTLVSDWAYTQTFEIAYSNLSAWLLLFGLLGAGIVTAFAVLALFGGWSSKGFSMLGAALFAAAFVVELINFMIHNRDGATTVIGTGITLSIVGALLILAGAWFVRTPVAQGQYR